jgi:dTDP-4-dehydrorhamnose 3,5-epimerase
VADVTGVVVITPTLHGDERGLFVETYRREWFPDGHEMVQGNRSDKQRGAVVGLHFHRHQADYWYVPRGRARVVLHDLRTGSPTERATMAFDIGDHDHRGVWIPPGVAHGFAAVTDVTMTYLVDRYYDPGDELGVAWDDPEIGADWALPSGAEVVLSTRDQTNPSRAALAGAGSLPVYAAP